MYVHFQLVKKEEHECGKYATLSLNKNLDLLRQASVFCITHKKRIKCVGD